MATDPTELARRTASTRSPSEGVDGMLEYVHPEFEMETLPGIAAEPQRLRGHDGVRRWFDSFYEVMDEVEDRARRRTSDSTDGRVLMAVQDGGTRPGERDRGRAGGGGGRDARDGLMRRLEFSAPGRAAPQRRDRAERAPSRRSRPLRPPRSRVTSTTVEGSPPSSPPSIARSTPAAIADLDRRSNARRGRARRCGWRSSGTGRRAAPASGPSIRRMPSRSGSSRQALRVEARAGSRPPASPGPASSGADRIAASPGPTSRGARAAPAARRTSPPRACRRRAP